MDRPKLTLVEVKELIKKSGFTITEAVMVVAIRGYYKNTMGKPGENDRGIYDDAMVLIGPNYIQTFNANTDPSRFKKGIATLLPGLHYFKKGRHNLSRPGKEYAAFRPDTPDEGLPVKRDGVPGPSRGIAINIHKGGLFDTFSAGCQTLFPDQWPEFQTKTYYLMDKEGQRRLPYLLLEQ